MFSYITDLLYHEKSSVKLCSLGIVNNILSEYTNPKFKLKEFDRNLIKSFYMKVENEDVDVEE